MTTLQFFQLIAVLLAAICLPTAILDMMSNGRYAEWAGTGLLITGICMIFLGATGFQ